MLYCSGTVKYDDSLFEDLFNGTISFLTIGGDCFLSLCSKLDWTLFWVWDFWCLDFKRSNWFIYCLVLSLKSICWYWIGLLRMNEFCTCWERLDFCCSVRFEFELSKDSTWFELGTVLVFISNTVSSLSLAGLFVVEF